MIIFNTPVWQVLLAIAFLPIIVAIIKQRIYEFKVTKADRYNAPLNQETQRLRIENADILRGGKRGEAGEQMAQAAVDRVLSALGVWYCTNTEAGYPSAVLLPIENKPYSSEIDLLVTTWFGVYAIEVKHWSGYCSHAAPGTLKIEFPTEEKIYADPLKKTVGKLERIIANVPMEISSKAIVLITDRNGRFDPKMNSNYLHISELEHFFRSERDRNQNFDDPASIAMLKKTVFETLDKSPTAKHDHLMRLSPDGEVGKYQANHARLAVLNVTPREHGPACKPVLRGWLTIAGLLLAGSALIGFKFPVVEAQAKPVKELATDIKAKKLADSKHRKQVSR